MSKTTSPADNRRSWDDFSTMLVREASTTMRGRKALRRSWLHLRELVRKYSPHVTDAEVRALLGKDHGTLDPESNDMKAFVAYCVGKGIAHADELTNALHADMQADPMAFLADHSGKSFGEKWTPIIAKYWLHNADDGWQKMKGRDYFDIEWTPQEVGRPIRIELKASSEEPEFRFQQIRHSRLNEAKSSYDILLCMGVTSSRLEWWVIPTQVFDRIAGNNNTPDAKVVMRAHHGKDRPIWNDVVGYKDEAWFVTDEKCRNILAAYHSTSEAVRGKMIDVFGPMNQGVH